ncbi:hypothetical protein CQW23_24960 [Capsicum baccatum]|uniref:ribonuclease Z n=1 Tax=Capsicum baccatum TaxID=33114 RepID=A0A2G2VWA1_CAPBA|nr:hypothetical protein CQW23_24960 [Capsicum baccatum]
MVVERRIPLVGSGGTKWLARSNGLSLKKKSHMVWSWFERKHDALLLFMHLVLSTGYDPILKGYTDADIAVTCDHRRLLISSNWWANTSFEVSGPLVRSLVVTGRRSDFPRPHVSSLYHNFILLRVLDLGSVNVGNDFPVGLEKMTLLKYLEDLPQLVSLTLLRFREAACEFNFPSNLRRLTLSDFCLPWDHISVIGRQLVNLEALKLHNNAFHGSSWEKLKELHRNLGGCTKLMEIEVKWCSQFLQASAMTVKERHIEELKNRRRAQEYFWNKRNMKIGKVSTSWFITMDTQETSPSVLLCFDKERFIFNAGEVCRFAIAITKTKVLRVLGNPNDTSIVYICKLHDITGKVDKDKAKACGLNPGRKLGQLQKGFSVKSDLLDIEVHPDDVIGPTIPGPIVLIVDCPTEPHAQELLSAQALEAYYSDFQSNSPETAKVVSCIIHLSPATVINSPVYEKWMRKFDSAQHIMARIPRYGIIGADSAVRNLKCIWISHIHADHHAGLSRMLALRRDLLKGVTHEPIVVIGPEQIGEFLKEYIKLEDLDMLFLDFDDITLLKWLKKVLSEAGLVRLISFPVEHCPDTEAFGVILESAERMNHDKVVQGWKVVYSGDMRPCSQVIEASLGATILIHEATFEDGLVEEAIARNHSTIKEAIEVGDSADLPLLPKVLRYLKLLFRNNG